MRGELGPPWATNMSDQSDPLSADEKFDIAVAAHESGDLPVAEREYRQILGENPDDPVVLHLLGSILTATGRAIEGVPLLERSVDIDPESGPAWAQLALARMQGARPDAAIDAWGRAWALDADTVSHLAATFAPLLEHQAPERPDCWQLAGEARLASGRNDFAERDFRNAMSHAPTEDAARTSLGGLLLLSGERTEAVEVLRTNRPLESMSTSRRINLAQAYFHNGAHEQAILALEGLRPKHDVEIRAAASTRAQSAFDLEGSTMRKQP
jgi:predicted Zn-dependent protease